MTWYHKTVQIPRLSNGALGILGEYLGSVRVSGSDSHVGPGRAGVDFDIPYFIETKGIHMVVTATDEIEEQRVSVRLSTTLNHDSFRSEEARLNDLVARAVEEDKLPRGVR